MTRKLTPHPFEIPDVQRPKLFTGFLCVLFAGERCHAGVDTNSSEDAYWDAIRSARLSMADACAVDKTIDPSAHAGSVLMFRVEEGEYP
jgi:hypothetical protein